MNGVPKKHWRLNGSALITKIFPQALVPTELPNGNGQEAESEGQRGKLDSAVLPNGNGDIPAPEQHDDPLDSAELPNGNG